MTTKVVSFQLLRHEDPGGVSGTGLIAVGVVFPSGRVVLEWLVPVQSLGIYETIEQVRTIHGHGGKTEISWIDPPP